MATEVCDRCGRVIPPGEIRYLLRIRAAADDGGFVPDPIEDHEIEHLVDALQKIDPAAVGRTICEEASFVVCPPCRRVVMTDPLQRGEAGDGPAGSGPREERP